MIQLKILPRVTVSTRSVNYKPLLSTSPLYFLLPNTLILTLLRRIFVRHVGPGRFELPHLAVPAFEASVSASSTTNRYALPVRVELTPQD